MRRMHELDTVGNEIVSIDGYTFKQPEFVSPINIRGIEDIGQYDVTINDLEDGKNYIILVYTGNNGVVHTTNTIFEIPFSRNYSVSSSNGMVKRNSGSYNYYINDTDFPGVDVQGVKVIQLDYEPNTDEFI